MELRRVTLKDFDKLFQWINDEDVRKNARYTQKVSRHSFEFDFLKNIENPNIHHFIIIDNNYEIGQIKISKEKVKVVYSYSIDKNYRNKGFGLNAIKLAENYIKDNKKEFKDVNELVAYVRNSNIGSCKIFENLLYNVEFKNNDYTIYIKKL